VRNVFENSPRQGRAEAGDVITSMDGERIRKCQRASRKIDAEEDAKTVKLGSTQPERDVVHRGASAPSRSSHTTFRDGRTYKRKNVLERAG